MLQHKTIRVLVVEDNYMVREMIRGRLEELDYTVVGEAADGRMALKMVQSIRPEVVLMDIEMPDMDGIEATRQIFALCPTPVVILTAHETPEFVRQASQAGAGAYLVKLPKAAEIERAITIAMARFDDMIELRRLNAELDAFAHTAAHDLQNPLNIIINYAALLQEEARLSEEHQGYLTTLIRSAHRMYNVIEELLLLAVARQAEVAFKPLNMGRIVAEAQLRLTDLIQQYRAEFYFPERWPTALGYAPWVEEVWVNYLSNGIKYGGYGDQPPRLRLGATERSDGSVSFWVRDNGPGLTAEQQARLFTPFTRLDQVRATGYGLGLSIVRRIVERLGGQVGVESEGVSGRGCKFFFTLPTRRD